MCIHKGVNPDEISVKAILSYADKKDEFDEWDKNKLLDVAGEIFGEK